MQQFMNKLYNGENLSFEDAQQLFQQMLSGELDPIQISAVLMAFKVKGESSNEIAALVQTMRTKAKVLGEPDARIYADCCGTGGDGFNTFNVSTASAFVAAQCGLSMVKHGNRSVSSRYGSADIIEALGIDLHSPTDKTLDCVNSTGFSFLFAPDYHLLMSHVVPVRKMLATPTIFNLAGPLANPAAPPVQLMGVCREELCQPLADVLLQLGCEKALVVYGAGLDEVALHAETKAVMVENGRLKELTLTPELAGLSRQPLSEIQLKEEDNPLEMFLQVLSGNGSKAMTDMLALNSGTLLWLAGVSDSLESATIMAAEAIRDGSVNIKLEQVRRFYQS